MISLKVKAWLENIVLGLLMGAKGCADLSAFRAPAVKYRAFSRHFVRLPARAAEAVAKSRALA
jgi:hypothetical protein